MYPVKLKCKVITYVFLCIKYVHVCCIHNERNKSLLDEDQLVYSIFSLKCQTLYLQRLSAFFNNFWNKQLFSCILIWKYNICKTYKYFQMLKCTFSIVDIKDNGLFLVMNPYVVCILFKCFKQLYHYFSCPHK